MDEQEASSDDEALSDAEMGQAQGGWPSDLGQNPAQPKLDSLSGYG